MKYKDTLKWQLNKLNKEKNNVYRAIYNDLCGDPIEILTDDLSFQVKIEQLAINNYLLGFKKAEQIYQKKLADLRHQRKVYLERIRGLEAIIKENGYETFDETRNNCEV